MKDLFFLSFLEDGKLQFTGVIGEDLGEGNYLVFFFSALSGHLNNGQIVRLETMRRQGWVFYPDKDNFNTAVEHHIKALIDKTYHPQSIIDWKDEL